MEIEVYAESVTWGEVAHVISKILPPLTRSPMVILSTVSEIAVQRAEAELAKAHPAVRVFVHGDRELWLGAEAPTEALVQRGWTSIPAPKGVTKGCDYARDPEKFRAEFTPLPDA